MLPNVYAGAAARHSGRPFVFSVHGMMAPAALKRSRWKKAIFDWLGQRRSLASATCFHATSHDEYEDIRRRGYRQPVCVVPFGIDIPKVVRKAACDRRTLLFLGRVHPIKRIDVLLLAWRAVQGAFPDWDLVICGPDNDGHLPTLQRLAKELGTVRVSFVGPKYSQEKEDLLDACDLLVLPSFSENFGFVVAEALAHAVPAIVTRAAPWDGLLQHSCGWWIDISPESLERCLRDGLALERSALKQMGQRGRDWMTRDLSWSRAAEMMGLTYEWLLGRSAIPSWVAVD
jgi:glycosyltransferase involved in cell wall biosynthesis